MGGKRRVVLELMKLGMELDRAMITAECTADEMEELQSDEQFVRSATLHSAMLERDLLLKMERIIEFNSAIGNSTEVRWMLERINSKRWGSGANRGLTVKGKGNGDQPFSFEVSFVEPEALYENTN